MTRTLLQCFPLQFPLDSMKNISCEKNPETINLAFWRFYFKNYLKCKEKKKSVDISSTNKFIKLNKTETIKLSWCNIIHRQILSSLARGSSHL